MVCHGRSRWKRERDLTVYKFPPRIRIHQTSSSSWKSRRLTHDSADLHNFTRWGQTGLMGDRNRSVFRLNSSLCYRVEHSCNVSLHTLHVSLTNGLQMSGVHPGIQIRALLGSLKVTLTLTNVRIIVEQVCFVTEREESIYLYQWGKRIQRFITKIKKYIIKEYIHVKCLLNEQLSENR